MNTAAFLRETGSLMYAEPSSAPGAGPAELDPFYEALGDLLHETARRWEQVVEATQRPSSGIDEPPAIFFGQPGKAAAHADALCVTEIRIARAWREAGDR